MNLSITRHVVNDAVVRVAVAGEVDLTTCELMAAALHDAIVGDHIAELIVDLDRVTFMDSTGIRALVSAHRAAHEQSVEFVVINARDVVRQVFDVTGVARLWATPT